GGGALLARRRRHAAPRPLRRRHRGSRSSASMSRPLTVLHVVANRWWTGSAEPVLRLVLALQERGYRALLGLAGGDRFEAKAREAGVEPLDPLRLDVKSSPPPPPPECRPPRAPLG